MRVRSVGLLGTCLILAILFAGSIQASDKLFFDGYYKSFFMAYNIPEIKDDFTGLTLNPAPVGSVVNRLRLNGYWRPSPVVDFHIAYDLSPTVQDPVFTVRDLSSFSPNPEDYRITDLDPRLYPGMTDPVGSFAVYHNLDRLLFTLRARQGDVYIGRQAISFGSARALNPTDVLVPFNYQALDTEDRLGVDAVRVRVPLGSLSELDLGVVSGTDFKPRYSAAFVRTRFYVARSDVTFLALAFREHFLLGFDLARAIGGAGFWTEAAYVWTNSLGGRRISNQDYLRVTVGGDYAITSESYLFAEYHYNQPGTDNADDYVANFAQAAYFDGAVYLLGEHYLSTGISHQLSPLVLGGMQVLSNLSDWSFLVGPQIEYNLAENVYLQGGAFVGIGKSPATRALPGSEFGSSPDMFFGSFRFYF